MIIVRDRGTKASKMIIIAHEIKNLSMKLEHIC